mgnify:CR=1 FL=1
MNLLVLPALRRQLTRAYQYYLTVMLSLVLTLTMVFSVFSILDVSYLQLLPYGESEQLYVVDGQMEYHGAMFAGSNSQNLLTLQQNSGIFSKLAIYFSWTTYKLYDQPTRPEVPVYLASHNFFDVLQTKPVLGRFFNEQEAFGNHQPSAVLSYRVWQRDFGGDPDVIGQSIQLNQRRFTIIGVTSDNWVLPQQTNASAAIWLPLDMDEQLNPRIFGGYSSSIKALGRLQAGLNTEVAGEQLSKQMAEAAAVNTPDQAKSYPVSALLTPFTQAVRGDSDKVVLMLVAGVGLLMLIALINLGNLQLARAVSRIQPLAVSFAFGATRRQIFLDVFRHNLLLSAAAALLALVLTLLSFGLLRQVGAEVLPRLDALAISGFMLVFALLVILAIALIFSWIELKTIDETQLQRSLQSSGKGTGKQLKQGVSHSLIGLQLLFSVLTLAAGSQVLMGSLTEAFRSNQISTTQLWSVVVNYSAIPEQDSRVNLQRAVAEFFKATPQINRVSRSSEPRVPLAMNWETVNNEQGESLSSSRIIAVDENHLALYGLTTSGRSFNRDDLALETKPVLINQRLAAKLDGNPIGQKVLLDSQLRYEIIGVVGNTDFPGNRGFESAELYYPAHYTGGHTDTLLLQTDTYFAGFSHAGLYAQLVAIDPRLDLVKVSAVSSDFRDLNRNQRFAAWLAGVISLVSLLMVCAGISGMVSYMVRMRRYDLGVKLALGATPKLLLRSQLQDVAKPVAAAALFGFSLAYFAIGYSRTRPEWHFALYWPELLLSILLILLITAISCFVPVWQVLKTDPIKALRNE